MAVSAPTSLGHASASGAPSPAASAGCEDEGQRYLEDGLRSDLSDKCPAGLSGNHMSETLRSSGSEAHGVSRRGEAVVGVPDRPRRRSDSSSPAVPGDELERRDGAKQRRAVSVDVRLTSAERAAIRTRAQVLGVRPSAWVRAVALDALDARRAHVEEIHAVVAMRPHPELARAVEQLRRVGVNLNQTRRDGSVVEEQLLREVLDAVDEVRASLGDWSAS